MPRAHVPASPIDDLSGRRHDRIADGNALTYELSAFMQSGLSVIVGSVGPDRHPVAGAALACRVDRNGTVRVLLARPANVPLLNAVAQGGGVAVTFSRPRDHRSIQVKAPSARLVSVAPDDHPEIVRQCAGLRDELVNGGYSPAFSSGYVAHEIADLIGIEFFPERAFVQTPGPGAGSELPR